MDIFYVRVLLISLNCLYSGGMVQPLVSDTDMLQLSNGGMVCVPDTRWFLLQH
jgi:hypothetical protein